jgi:hypothetical protein
MESGDRFLFGVFDGNLTSFAERMFSYLSEFIKTFLILYFQCTFNAKSDLPIAVSLFGNT